nr:uncharacterized protein LOC108013942 [Drosophila suzukii]XP_016935441.1 uncharacterized protein LOC108013942 [Drosophila suzukii]
MQLHGCVGVRARQPMQSRHALSLLSAQRLELENFLLPAKRESQCQRAKESAMIPPTFATPPLPPEKAFDDTQRSIKSSISGNPRVSPPPNIGQKVALVAPKKLYQLKFALKNIRKMRTNELTKLVPPQSSNLNWLCALAVWLAGCVANYCR